MSMFPEVKPSALSWRRVRHAWEYSDEPSSVRVLAGAFWWGLLVVVSVCVLVAFSLGAWFFFITSREAPLGVETAEAALPFSRAEIEETIRTMEERGDAYESLRASGLRANDPGE